MECWKEEIKLKFYTDPRNRRHWNKLSDEDKQKYPLPEVKPIVSQKTAWKRYYREVWKITRNQDLASLEHYDKRITQDLVYEEGLKIMQSEEYYSLDHKISIWYRWKNNYPVEQIGSIENLRYIPALQNSKKGITPLFD